MKRHHDADESDYHEDSDADDADPGLLSCKGKTPVS